MIDRGDSRVQIVPKIRNLVGYFSGISGHQLLLRLRHQALQYNAKMIKGEAVIYRRHDGFKVCVENQSYFSKYVVLATGFKDKQPKDIDMAALCKQGVIAYCPICDGFDHSDESIGVLVSSSEGFRKLKFLYNFTKRLHVILIRDIPIPSRHIEKIRKLGVKVHVGALENLRFVEKRKNLQVKLHGQKPFEVKMAYVALGMRVSKKAVEHLKKLRRTKDGLILVNSHQETSISGLYAVGDCVKALAQVSVAVGHAAVAATHIHNQLSRKKSIHAEASVHF